MAELCKATTKKGTPCPTKVKLGGTFCYFHDPLTTAAMRSEHARQAGLASKGHPKRRGKTPEELHIILTEQLDRFLMSGGAQPTVDSITAICTIVKAIVPLFDRIKDKAADTAFGFRKAAV